MALGGPPPGRSETPPRDRGGGRTGREWSVVVKEISLGELEERVKGSPLPVVLDIWDPNCPPCVALLPRFAELAEEMGDRILFLKMNRAENREVMVRLGLRWVPTLIFYRAGGTEVRRLSGDQEATPCALEEGLLELLAPEA
jgi:thioredoxin-like negative regulator of GroEL